MGRMQWVLFGMLFLVVFGTLIGCGNGNDVLPGSGTGSGQVMLSVSAAGPAGMAPLASVKATSLPQPAIFPSDLPTSTYRAWVRSALGSTQVTSLYLSEDKQQLKFEQTFPYAPEFIIEIFPQGFTPGTDWQTNLSHALFRGVVTVSGMDNTRTIVQTVAIGSHEIAQAMAFEHWKQTVAPNGAFSQFVSQVAATGVASLAQGISSGLASLTANQLGSSTFVFTWASAIINDSGTLGQSVPAPADPGDTTPPAVVAVSPVANAENVALETPIQITFNESILASTIGVQNLTLSTSSGQPVPGSAVVTGTIVTFTPAAPLTYETGFLLTVTGVKDLRGNTMTTPYSSGFRTQNDPAGDRTPPTITSVTPANGLILIATSTIVSFSFSEAIDITTVTTSNVQLLHAGTVVPGTVTVSGSTGALFTPTVLLPGKLYTLMVNGIKDLAGNTMTSPFSSSFTTLPQPGLDDTAPRVIGINPAHTAIGVATGTTVTITVSEGLKPETVTSATIGLFRGVTPIDCSVAYSAGQIILTPAAALTFAETFTVRVASGIMDLAGNRLAPEFSSTFTTIPEERTIAQGFRSFAFPAAGNSATVYHFPPGATTTVVLVNTTAADQTYHAGGSLSIAANTRHPNLIARPKNLTTRPLTRPQEFNNLLRELEHKLPAFQRTPDNRRRGLISRDVIGNTATFKVVQDTGPTVSAPSTCRQVLALPSPATTGNTNFYVDDDITWNADSQAFVSQLVTAWPAIFTTIRQNFGSEPPTGAFNGITLNEDITILVLDSGKIDPLNEGVAGFFYGGDLYSSTTDPDSNERKIFYINYWPGFLTFIKGTLAHEFQHMVNFYQRKSRSLEEEDWLNEAMSGYAEHLCGYGVPTNNSSKANQVSEFLLFTETNPLTEWLGGGDDYGQVYLFGTWLGRQYGSSGSVADLLRTSPQTGADAVANFTGKSFAEILAEWSLALYVNDTSGSNRYGIPGLDLRTTYHYSDGNVTLNGPLAFVRPAPFSGTFDVSTKAVSYIEIGGGNGSHLQLTLPTNGHIFELHK